MQKQVRERLLLSDSKSVHFKSLLGPFLFTKRHLEFRKTINSVTGVIYVGTRSLDCIPTIL